MRSQHSLEEIAELYGLLENIKKEYEDGIHSVLRKSNPELFSNPHTIPVSYTHLTLPTILRV